METSAVVCTDFAVVLSLGSVRMQYNVLLLRYTIVIFILSLQRKKQLNYK